MKMSDSFVFYRSFMEAIEDVTDEEAGQLIKALAAYALDGEKPQDLDKIPNIIFKMAKAQIDANHRRIEEGKRGGRPNKKTIVSENAEIKKPWFLKILKIKKPWFLKKSKIKNLMIMIMRMIMRMLITAPTELRV